MFGSCLYYPYIDIYDSSWLRSAVLFSENIKTIAPYGIEDPYIQSDTLTLFKEGFLEPVRCEADSIEIESLCSEIINSMIYMSENEKANEIALESLNPFGEYYLGDDYRYQYYALLRNLDDGWRPHCASERLPEKFMLPKLLDRLREFDPLSLLPEHAMWARSILPTKNVGSREDYRGWITVSRAFAFFYMAALAKKLGRKHNLVTLTNEREAASEYTKLELSELLTPGSEEKTGAIISFIMETIKIDPETKIDKILEFRRSRESQFAELSAQFDDLSAKFEKCETNEELKEKAKAIYVRRIKPKLDNLRSELRDSSIQSVWEGIQRAVTISVPAGGALAYFTGLTGTTLLAAGAALSITDIAVKTHLAHKKSRRASPYTYLLDVERKFSLPRY